jgi:hypothetical protein
MANLDTWDRSLKGSSVSYSIQCTINYVMVFFYVGRHEETSKECLLLLWTKAAMMLDWGSSTLDTTTAGISHCCMVLRIALCWCWQWLLKVGGNILPHIVTPLDVTTVAWRCRQTQDVLHPAQCPPAALQTSQWQWTASVFTTWYCVGSCNRRLTADKCFEHNLTLGFGCWTGYRWYSASIRQVEINVRPCCISEWFLMDVISLFHWLNFTLLRNLKP